LTGRGRARRGRLGIAGAVALAAAALAWPAGALAQPASPFAPASPQARSVSDLFILLLVIAGLIFLLVQGMLLYMVARFRARPGDGEPRQVFGHRNLEIGWTAAPALILAVVFFLMLPAMRGASAPQGDALPIVAIGHQWWWEFQYPNQSVLTANELHIPVGQPVRVQLESADVIHSFWIPRLNGKTDLIPGKTNSLWLQAQEADTYLGQCAEFCGIQHAWMLLRVIAQAPADFDAWVANERQPAAAPAGGSPAAQGQQLFTQRTCVNCHTIQGTNARGTVGPDLTHMGSRQTIGAGVLDNTLDNMRRWLKNPQAVKPGSNMPDFHLSDADVDALAAYLEGLK
jgi:cytochrome c oxidase subunit 2